MAIIEHQIAVNDAGGGSLLHGSALLTKFDLKRMVANQATVSSNLSVGSTSV